MKKTMIHAEEKVEASDFHGFEGIPLPSRAKVYLKNATTEANCDILSDIREIVRNQVDMIKRQTRGDIMNSQQSTVLHNLMKVYQAMDSNTEKEHAKYDFSQISEDKLRALAGENTIESQEGGTKGGTDA